MKVFVVFCVLFVVAYARSTTSNRHKLTNAEEAVSKDIIEVIRAKRQFDSCEMLQGYNCPNKAESDRVVRKWGKEIICLLWEAVPAGGTICTKTMEVLVPTD